MNELLQTVNLGKNMSEERPSQMEPTAKTNNMAAQVPEILTNSANCANPAQSPIDYAAPLPQRARLPIGQIVRWTLAAIDGLYLLWLLLSGLAKLFAIASFAPLSMFPIVLDTDPIAWSHYPTWQTIALVMLSMSCSFTAICYYGHRSLEYQGRSGKTPHGHIICIQTFSLLLPLSALLYLFGCGMLHPVAKLAKCSAHDKTKTKAKSQAEIPDQTSWPKQSSAKRQTGWLLQASSSAAALILQLGLLLAASGYWPQMGRELSSALQTSLQSWLNPVIDSEQPAQSHGQEPNAQTGQTTLPISRQDDANYLPQLIHRVDIWFLSLKGISAALAILESSTVEVGALVYGSVSIGKILVPLRHLLQRIGDILFYGRLILTAVQIVQSLGQHYGVGLLLLLFALAVLEYLLRLLQITLRYFLKPDCQHETEALSPQDVGLTPAQNLQTPDGWRQHSLLQQLFLPSKILQFLRFHLFLLLFLSWCFEPSLQLLDNILETAVFAEDMKNSGEILGKLEQDYTQLDLQQESRSSWTALISSIQLWLQHLKQNLEELGQKLLYFSIWSIIRTIILPFFVLFVLFSLYRLLLKELLNFGRGPS